MKLQPSLDSEPKPVEQSAEVVAETLATDLDRAEALKEARAVDAANYVSRYEQFTCEVERLKFWDKVACMVFPAAAYMLALAVLLRGLLWLVEHSGSGQSSFAQPVFFMLIFGVVGLTAGAWWLSDRETKVRMRDRGERIQEIADRHGVEPGRPRMEG